MIIINRPMKHYQLQAPTAATMTFPPHLAPTHTFSYEQLSAGLHLLSKSHRDALENNSLDSFSVGGQLGRKSVLPITPPSFQVLSVITLLFFFSYQVSVP